MSLLQIWGLIVIKFCLFYLENVFVANMFVEERLTEDLLVFYCYNL